MTRADEGSLMVGVTDHRAEVPAADLPPIDYDQLGAGLGQDPEVLCEIVPIFLDESQSYLDRLSAAIRIGDARGVYLAGHTLAGSASLFAATAVTELAWRLERMGATGHLTGASEVLAALEGALARVRLLLETHVADLQRYTAANGGR